MKSPKSSRTWVKVEVLVGSELTLEQIEAGADLDQQEERVETLLVAYNRHNMTKDLMDQRTSMLLALAGETEDETRKNYLALPQEEREHFDEWTLNALLKLVVQWDYYETAEDQTNRKAAPFTREFLTSASMSPEILSDISTAVFQDYYKGRTRPEETRQ